MRTYIRQTRDLKWTTLSQLADHRRRYEPMRAQLRDPRLFLARCAPATLHFAFALVCVMGCGSASLRAAGATSASNTDPRLLNEQAGALLLSALNDHATEAAALRELSMAGAAALPWIVRATDERSGTPSTNTRSALVAELLGLRAEHGDQNAIDTLRQGTPSDPVALAIRIRWLAPDDDRPELITALRHSSERVRLAASRQLRRAPLEAATALEIGQLARLDPVAAVRASALETLATQGTAAIEILSSRLTDSDPLPRSVAMRELARIDCKRARSQLAEWLSNVPSRDSLAAVRALVPCGAPMTAETLVPLRRALASSDVALRAEAATTADVYSWREIPDWIATPLAHDPVPAVRLALALALMRTQEPAARATLIDLMHARATMVGVQAAAILAPQGNAQAISVLLDARVDHDPRVRRVAFVTLGRLSDRVGELAVGLHDPDVSVRLATAGALLRVTHAML